MLRCIRIRHLAIIEELEVEFGPGLNVITGETGAGKSILISALSLVLGERGRPQLVRTGAKTAEVEALFELGDDAQTRRLLADAGIDTDGELIVRRVINASGRTKAYLNGRLATAGQLSEIVSGLVDISSQHEHHTLVDPKSHLGYLDAFGQLSTQGVALSTAFRTLREADKALSEARKTIAERAQREDQLRFQIAEIDELEPVEGEETELEQERSRLQNAERLAEATLGVEQTLYAQDGALCERLGGLAREVRSAAGLDNTLSPLAEGFEDALAQLEELARELGSYGRQLTHDPGRLNDIEERLHQLKRLTRKYGGDTAAVLSYRADAAIELAGLGQAEERLEQLQAVRADALTGAADKASELSKERQAAALALGVAITEELSTLGMVGAQVQVSVAPQPESRAEGALHVEGARLSEHGIDKVEFLIAPNKGELARPLGKIASGGELSRTMLAIKRVLAGVGRAGLYVFDEVDAGVGGAVAEVIGQKLADVAAHHQVICITHLAQIAAYAGDHYRVMKRIDDERTQSSVHRLDQKSRLEEVARMMGGLNVTQRTRHMAAEMIEGAQRV